MDLYSIALKICHDRDYHEVDEQKIENSLNLIVLK